MSSIEQDTLELIRLLEFMPEDEKRQLLARIQDTARHAQAEEKPVNLPQQRA